LTESAATPTLPRNGTLICVTEQTFLSPSGHRAFDGADTVNSQPDSDAASRIRESLRANGLDPRPADLDRLVGSQASLRAAVDAMWTLGVADDVAPTAGFTARAPRPESGVR
jgi:hypothetical protein